MEISMLFLPLLLSLAMGAQGQEDRAAGIAAVVRQMKGKGFDLRSEEGAPRGTFRDPKSGFEGLWHYHGDDHRPSAALTLWLRLPAPLDRHKLLSELTTSESEDLQPGQYVGPRIKRLDISGRIELEAGYSDSSEAGAFRWQKAVTRARRLVELVGPQVPMSSDEQLYVFGQGDPLPPEFVVRSVSLTDLRSLAKQYGWQPSRKSSDGDPSDGPRDYDSHQFIIGLKDVPGLSVQVVPVGSQDERLLGPNHSAFEVRAILGVGNQESAPLIHAARRLLPGWTIKEDVPKRYDSIWATRRVDLKDGLTVEQIGEGVLDLMKDAGKALEQLRVPRR